MELRDQFTRRFTQALRSYNPDGERLKLKDLSRITGLSTRSLSLYKTGQRCPGAISGALLAQALHVSLDWLMGLSDDTTV
ncbi:MAG TPA: helix-turn-helix transcriptional regulator [Clostridia bacterium]|nr:helix-turn-helix transcriptional regulator [Clostridia bacterium]